MQADLCKQFLILFATWYTYQHTTVTKPTALLDQKVCQRGIFLLILQKKVCM